MLTASNDLALRSVYKTAQTSSVRPCLSMLSFTFPFVSIAVNVPHSSGFAKPLIFLTAWGDVVPLDLNFLKTLHYTLDIWLRFSQSVFRLLLLTFFAIFRIFQIAPEAQDYFSSSDLESDEFQGHITSVISTLDKALQNLDDLTPLLPTLERLGTTHANMGIKRQQLNVSIAGSYIVMSCQ